MAIFLAIIGSAIAAFCIWLAVRFVNRRERWAKWTLAVVVGGPLLYVASFGPACCLVGEGHLHVNALRRCYRPLANLVNCPTASLARDMLVGYASKCDGVFGLAMIELTYDPDDYRWPSGLRRHRAEIKLFAVRRPRDAG